MNRELRGTGLPHIVVIGGGTGLSTMLRGLKEKPLDITAIVTVADDGGSSGVLREELGIPPPGDIRNVLIALADVESLLSDLLQYRFETGAGLAGHSLGNLILAAMSDISGDFVKAVKELSRVLAVRGRVLPASNRAILLKAEMDDGTMVLGESHIPKSGKRIRRVSIEPPDVAPLDEAVKAIQEADAILLGPGSLFTSVIPNLLVPRIAQEINRSKALKMYVCNVMTQPGETDDYTAWDHVEAIRQHLGHDLIDYVIVNNGDIPPSVVSKYAEQGATPVKLDLLQLKKNGYRIIADDLVQIGTYLRHNPDKLSEHIHQLVESWMDRKR